jgi:hypothetical protein
MKNKSLIIIILVILIAIAAGVVLTKRETSPVPQQEPTGSTPNNLLLNHYKSEKYGFEFDYPSDWQVSEVGTIPVINVYKKSEKAQPPFGIHSTTTNIAIYPEGLGTEGPQSETVTDENYMFAGSARRAITFLLHDKTLWAKFISVNNGPQAKGWSEYAFVWSGLHIENEEIECVMANGSSRPGNCEFGVESEGAKTIRTGSVSAQDSQILDTILASFKFSQ